MRRSSGAFASLTSVAYRRLFIAGVIVFSATQGQQIARGWLTLELTGSNAGLGGVYLVFGVTMLLFTPAGGVISDRFQRRRVVVGAGCVLATTAICIGLADAFGWLVFWMLVVSAGLHGATIAIYGPARMAYTAELVDDEHLASAVALGQTGLNAAKVVAPSIAGLMISIVWIGTRGVYLCCAALLLLAVWKMTQLPRGTVDPSGVSAFSELVEGARYVAADRSLRSMLLLSLVVVTLGLPYLVFLPTIARDRLGVGASGYGLLSSSAAVAALAASLAVAGQAAGRHSGRLQLASGFTLGVGLMLLAVAPNMAVAVVATAMVGGAASAFQVVNNTLLLMWSDRKYHGRVQSLLMLGFSGFGLAALPLGVLGDAVGLDIVFLLMGGGCLVAIGAYWWLTREWEIGESGELAGSCDSKLVAKPLDEYASHNGTRSDDLDASDNDREDAMVQIEDGVEEIRSILRADGGDIEVIGYDEQNEELELRLLLVDANCAECVLPRELLETMGLDMVRAHVPEIRCLKIHDPRESQVT